MLKHSKTKWCGLIFLPLPNKQGAVSLRVQMTAMPTHYSPFLPPTSPILPISPHSHSLSPRWPATSDGRHNSGCTRDMLPINRILISREIWSTKVKVRAKVRLCQLPLLVLPVVEPVECGQPSKQWHHTVSLLLNYEQEWTKKVEHTLWYWKLADVSTFYADAVSGVSCSWIGISCFLIVSDANFRHFMHFFTVQKFQHLCVLHEWLATALILLCSLFCQRMSAIC